MEDVEIEIKLFAKPDTRLFTWLEKDAVFEGKTEQTDIYLDPPYKSFLYIDDRGKKTAAEYIRIRIEADNGVLCYKHIDKIQERAGQAQIDEIESKVEDPQKVIKIFEAIGFKQAIRIEKIRKSYRYKNFQLAFDTVKNLGDFLEIEYKGTIKNVSEGFKKINNLRETLHIMDWEEARGGYVELMLNK